MSASRSRGAQLPPGISLAGAPGTETASATSATSGSSRSSWGGPALLLTYLPRRYSGWREVRDLCHQHDDAVQLQGLVPDPVGGRCRVVFDTEANAEAAMHRIRRQRNDENGGQVEAELELRDGNGEGDGGGPGDALGGGARGGRGWGS